MLSLLRTAVSVALVFLVSAPAAGAWTWPASGSVLQAFELGDDPYAGGQHRGVDIAGEAGEAVMAPRSGTISFAGSVPTGGLSVTIATADGYSVTLVHLGSIVVRRNATIAEGAAVGDIGPSGVAEHPVPYVHLGVRVTADPNGYIDPLSFLPPRAPVPAPAPSPSPASAPAPPPQPVSTAAAPAQPKPLPAPQAAPVAEAPPPAAAPTTAPPGSEPAPAAAISTETSTPMPVQQAPAAPQTADPREAGDGPALVIESAIERPRGVRAPRRPLDRPRSVQIRQLAPVRQPSPTARRSRERTVPAARVSRPSPGAFVRLVSRASANRAATQGTAAKHGTGLDNREAPRPPDAHAGPPPSRIADGVQPVPAVTAARSTAPAPLLPPHPRLLPSVRTAASIASCGCSF